MLEGVQITNGINAKGPDSVGDPSVNPDRDISAAEAGPKFGDVWKDMQAKYGAKAEKPREIKKTLGKDDFLRIMVTQMKHQDPTEPFKAEQFAAQLAQFASVEQLQNINQNFGKMATQNQPLERLAMTSLIGKTVTVNRERFPHVQGQNESVGFVLPADAERVQVAVVNDNGEVMIQKEMGALSAGENKFTWDGVKTNTLPAATGTYQLKISAVDKRGQAIQTNGESNTRVIGVTFDGSEPHFLVGDVNKPDKIPMKSVVKIAEGTMMGAAPSAAAPQSLAQAVQAYQQGAQAPSPEAAQAAAAAAAAPQGPKANFFSFERGKGSTVLNPGKLDPQAQAALERYETEAAAASAARQAANLTESGAEAGFPNGLGADAFNVESEGLNGGAQIAAPNSAISASSNGLGNQDNKSEKGGNGG